MSREGAQKNNQGNCSKKKRNNDIEEITKGEKINAIKRKRKKKRKNKKKKAKTIKEK
jgi:hypothetical protein